MKKQRKSARQKTKSKAAASGTPAHDRGRREMLRMLRNGAIGIATIGVAGVFSVRAVRATMAEQDLSQVGQGRPSIVQIHDPNCSVCAALQRETRKALKHFDDEALDFFVANIQSDDGARFAAKYGVPHVTLLLFDSQGNLVNTLRGPQERDELRDVFEGFLREHSQGV